MSADSSKPLPKQAAAVTWGPWHGLLIVVVSFLVSQIIATGVIIALSLGVRTASQTAADWANSTLGQFIFVLTAEGLALFILWLFLRRRGSLAAIGFSRPPRLSDAGWTVVAGLGYFIILIVVLSLASAFLHVNTGQKQDIGFTAVHSHYDQFLAFISLVVLPPVVEEILFRGVLFGGFRKRLPFVWATVLTSIAFAIPHLLEGDGSILWVGGIDTLLLSFALCFLRERSGSLWPGIWLHMIKNSVAYLYLFIFVAR